MIIINIYRKALIDSYAEKPSKLNNRLLDHVTFNHSQPYVLRLRPNAAEE